MENKLRNLAMIRPSNEHQRLALKVAFKRGMRRVNGAASFAQITRVSEPTLSKYAAGHDHEHFPPIDVVLDLDLDIGAPAVLSELAALEGYGLVKVDAGEHHPGIEDVAVLARSACDVQVSLTNALADGRVCAREAVAMKPEIENALDCLRDLLARVNRIAEGSESARGAKPLASERHGGGL